MEHRMERIEFKRYNLFCPMVSDEEEPTRGKHLSDAPLWGRLLALPTNIRLDWKILQGQTLYLIMKSCNLRP